MECAFNIRWMSHKILVKIVKTVNKNVKHVMMVVLEMNRSMKSPNAKSVNPTPVAVVDRNAPLVGMHVHEALATVESVITIVNVAILSVVDLGTSEMRLVQKVAMKSVLIMTRDATLGATWDVWKNKARLKSRRKKEKCIFVRKTAKKFALVKKEKVKNVKIASNPAQKNDQKDKLKNPAEAVCPTVTHVDHHVTTEIVQNVRWFASNAKACVKFQSNDINPIVWKIVKDNAKSWDRTLVSIAYMNVRDLKSETNDKS